MENLKQKLNAFYANPTQEGFDELKEDELAFRLILTKSLTEFIAFFKVEDFKKASRMSAFEEFAEKHLESISLDQEDFKGLKNSYLKMVELVGQQVGWPPRDRALLKKLLKEIYKKAESLEELQWLYGLSLKPFRGMSGDVFREIFDAQSRERLFQRIQRKLEE